MQIQHFFFDDWALVFGTLVSHSALWMGKPLPSANGTSASAGGKFPDAKKTLKLIQDGDYFADNQMPEEVDSATLWLLNSK